MTMVMWYSFEIAGTVGIFRFPRNGDRFTATMPGVHLPCCLTRSNTTRACYSDSILYRHSRIHQHENRAQLGIGI